MRTVQIPPPSTLTHPFPARSLFSGSLFQNSVFHLDNFSQIEDPYLLYPYIQPLRLHVCSCFAGCPHSGPSARLALCPPRSWSVRFIKKCSCQAMMGFGGQPRALLLSSGRQASQRSSSLCCTITRAGSLTGVPKQRGLQRGKNRGELTATSGCHQDLLCGSDYWGQWLCGGAQANRHLTLTLVPIKYNSAIVRKLNRCK